MLFLVLGVIPKAVADTDWSMAAFFVFYLAVLFPWMMKGDVLKGGDRTKATWVVIGVMGALGILMAVFLGGMTVADLITFQQGIDQLNRFGKTALQRKPIKVAKAKLMGDGPVTVVLPYLLLDDGEGGGIRPRTD